MLTAALLIGIRCRYHLFFQDHVSSRCRRTHTRTRTRTRTHAPHTEMHAHAHSRHEKIAGVCLVTRACQTTACLSASQHSKATFLLFVQHVRVRFDQQLPRHHATPRQQQPTNPPYQTTRTHTTDPDASWRTLGYTRFHSLVSISEFERDNVTNIPPRRERERGGGRERHTLFIFHSLNEYPPAMMHTVKL